MFEKLLEKLGGDSKWEKKARRWQQEVAATEERLRVKAQEEKVLKSLRERRGENVEDECDGISGSSGGSSGISETSRQRNPISGIVHKPTEANPNALQPTVPPPLVHRNSVCSLEEEGHHSDLQSPWFQKDEPRQPDAYQRLLSNQPDGYQRILLTQRGREDIITSERLNSADRDETMHSVTDSHQEPSYQEPQTIAFGAPRPKDSVVEDAAPQIQSAQEQAPLSKALHNLALQDQKAQVPPQQMQASQNEGAEDEATQTQDLQNPEFNQHEENPQQQSCQAQSPEIEQPQAPKSGPAWSFFLVDPSIDLTTYSLSLIGLCRFTNTLDPKYIHDQLSTDIRAYGGNSFHPSKHPLHLLYNVARDKAIEAGKPDPGEVGWIIKPNMPKDAWRWRLRSFQEFQVYVDEEGVAVQRGWPGVISPEGSAFSNTFTPNIPDSQYWAMDQRPVRDLGRERSTTLDGRLAGAVEERGKHGDRAGWDGTADPAEGIAAYHERADGWFGLGTEGGERRAASLAGVGW